MENYSYNSSYPDSEDTSPRSREIDFDGQPQNLATAAPWDDRSSPSAPYKAKFLCSYGGKIQPRPHDNQLSYLGGDTKILAVDRSVRFPSLLSKLSALCGGDPNDLSFKYQLPGEDLDALISVTNDDDLDHMMHEYDRLYKSSPKPARMRLFLFPNPNVDAGSNTHSSYGSDGGKSDRDRFVEALNSGPSGAVHDVKSPPLPALVPAAVAPPANNVDFLFGLEKGIPDVVPPHPSHLAGAPPPPPPQVVRVPDFPPEFHDDRSDLAAVNAQLQRMHLREQFELHHQQQQQQARVIPGYLAGGRPGDDGEYYLPRAPPAGSIPMPAAPPSYWPEKQVAGGYHQVSQEQQQPMYVIPGPGGGVYHASPMMRPLTGQAGGQGYYMQRMTSGLPVSSGPHDVYREQPVYGVPQQPQQQQQQLPSSSHPGAGPHRAMGEVPPAAGGGGGGYAAQVAYDSATGRQVYYTAAAPPGVVVPGGGALGEGKVTAPKAASHSQGSV